MFTLRLRAELLVELVDPFPCFLVQARKTPDDRVIYATSARRH